MQPEQELFLNKKLETEREVSNKTYAIKLVEKIVFAFMGLIAVAFIAFLTAKVWPH